MKVRFFRDKPRLVFFIGYTILFLIAVKAAVAVTPFVAALLIALIMKPLYDYLRTKFRFRSDFAATVLTLLIFSVVFAAAGMILFLVIRQALSLLQEHRDFVNTYLQLPRLTQALSDRLLSGDLLSAASSAAKAVFRTVPLVITFVILTFAATVFFLHHLEAIRDRLLDRAGEFRDTLGRVFSIAYSMIRRFIRSYLILYLITFVEAVVIFYLTGVSYPLAYAFITAIADILPILGPGTVYVPFAIVFILQKNYTAGIAILVGFLITVVIRQITEPRIVSSGIKIHPLVILTAIYFSVYSMNIWVLFYAVSVLMAYRVLDAAGVFEKG